MQQTKIRHLSHIEKKFDSEKKLNLINLLY